MDRLTVNDLNKVCYDPWELCGMGGYCKKGCHEEGGCTKGCHILKMYRKLSEYEDLEEEGKLLRLENNFQKIMIGEDVFIIVNDSIECGKICFIKEWWNDYQGFRSEYHAMCGGMGNIEFEYADFGKTVFLTQEQAENALKELKEREGENGN